MADQPTEYGDFALKGFLGFQIEEVAEGHARARLTIADEHRNPNGVAHGAVYFAMVDTAMGAARCLRSPTEGSARQSKWNCDSSGQRLPGP
jgi:uncharacterized protein (TIGR00369 family)